MKRILQASALAVALLLAGASWATEGGKLPAYESFTYLLVLFLHQVLFVFWLGPDIGVYMWSTKVLNTELSPGQRVAAGRMMQVIGLLPQVCMSLMLTVGGVLTELRGIDHPWWQMAAIWLLGPIWLSLTLYVYATAGSAKSAQLARLDLWFRWLVIVSVVLSVVYSVSTGRLEGVPWVTAKLLLFAAVVLFGLRMRLRLAPFVAGLEQLAAAGSTPELEMTLKKSINRARPFMYASWLALALRLRSLQCLRIRLAHPVEGCAGGW
jgi:hypothetical protein